MYLHKGGWLLPYYFLHDSSKFLAFITGTSIFLFFKNLDMEYSLFINNIAKTVFGILIIHGTMRDLVWYRIFDVAGKYNLSAIKLILFAFVSCTIVFFICSVIDFCRIKYLEEPFFYGMINIFQIED